VAAARFLVSGRVQGVFFRASTQTHARSLRLTGFARNLDDGRVEVIAVGDVESLARLEDWLQRGPPSAGVHSVERSEAPVQHFVDFATH
jgi:acylphosphatase